MEHGNCIERTLSVWAISRSSLCFGASSWLLDVHTIFALFSCFISIRCRRMHSTHIFIRAQNEYGYTVQVPRQIRTQYARRLRCSDVATNNRKWRWIIFIGFEWNYISARVRAGIIRIQFDKTPKTMHRTHIKHDSAWVFLLGANIICGMFLLIRHSELRATISTINHPTNRMNRIYLQLAEHVWVCVRIYLWWWCLMPDARWLYALFEWTKWPWTDFHDMTSENYCF